MVKEGQMEHRLLARQPASGGPAVQSWPAWGLLPPTPGGEKKASGGPAVQSWPTWSLGNHAIYLPFLKGGRYSENRKNRARVIIFDIGWGPGCGVGGPDDGFFNVNSHSGLPLFLTPRKLPLGPQKQ